MKLKKTDWILLLGILLLAGAFCLIKVLFVGVNSGGSVEVRIDGELVGTYSLDADIKEIFEHEDGSYNIMVITEGKVLVSEADCPDRHCVAKGEIYRVNETIICLPHKLVIKVTEGDSKGPDVVAE